MVKTLNLKFFVVFLCCVIYFQLPGQSITKIQLQDKSLQISDIAALSNSSSIGIKNAPKLAAINVIDNNTDLRKTVLMSFTEAANISAHLMFHNGGHLKVITIKLLNDTEALLIGQFEQSGASPLMFIAKFDLRIKAISECRLITLSTDPSFQLIPVDVIIERDDYYILAQTYVDYLSNQQSKVVLLKTKGLILEWAYAYNTIAPVHSESPSSIAFSPLGTLIIGGVITTAGDNFPRMMLMEITKLGLPVKLKKVELFAPNQIYSHRYGWTFVKSLGANIHLFSQSVIGRSEPGPVLVTMFDVNLDLRTWRNYEVPIRVESSLIEPGLFYFGGQAPVENGLNGYVIMKVNSTNAIVEAIKNFKEEIYNVSLATSSRACFESNSRSLWSLVKPNGGQDDHLVLLQNDLLLNTKCAEDFNSNVYKDTIRSGIISLNEISLKFETSNLDCRISSAEIYSMPICETTSVENELNENFSLYIARDNVIHVNLDDELKSITMYNVHGQVLELRKKAAFQYELLDKEFSGIAIVSISLKSGKLFSFKAFIY